MANDVTQERIRRALQGVLLPLARTLLRCGVSYTEFAELAKRAFVDAASTDYGVRNRPTNMARVAVMTGLSRKEVGRIRSQSRRKVQDQPHGITLPAAVLNEWHTNRRFSDRFGTPMILPYSGKGATFSALVRIVSRDSPPGAMRRELLRGGAIRTIRGRNLMATKRYFVPDSADEKVLVGLELGLRRLAETVEFNSNPENFGASRFQRFVEGPQIRTGSLMEARKAVQSMLTTFSVRIDDCMASFGEVQPKHSRRNTRACRLGVGLYYFDESPE